MTTMNVSMKRDSDGFLSQECPSCNRCFKVQFGEGSDKPVAFCPYCEHAGEQCWWTTEQVAYFSGVASERVVGPMLDKFAQEINQMSRSGDLISISASVRDERPVSEPVESNEPMAIAEFACCGERIKHDGSASRLRCIICGKVGTG